MFTIFYIYISMPKMCSGYCVTLAQASKNDSNQVFSEISPDNVIVEDDSRVRV